MALEIEHKFLVRSTDFRNLAKPIFYRQGYLVISDTKVVRVRIAGEQGFITIKARVTSLTRKEFEYKIPITDAELMLAEMCVGSVIEKLRYRIDYQGFIWEVDEFLGENEGLIVAEIEVDTEEQEFAKPDWVGLEVTNEPRYLNAYLSEHPYKSWKQ
ncbi:MAG: adenylate cyclase [Bacteroidetes bacterium HGW-Bacteroidetes-9]|jgi:CYTH domain-containing protein|nr:MAG: adenylate cyclase [Bacteroidetes bacterium HGW-Bacteroidetes-9]